MPRFLSVPPQLTGEMTRRNLATIPLLGSRIKSILGNLG
jgi:hypothetical protein